MGGHDQKSHGDGNYGAHELDPNPVDGCHGGELMQVCLTTFFLKKNRVQMLLLDCFAGLYRGAMESGVDSALMCPYLSAKGWKSCKIQIRVKYDIVDPCPLPH